MFLEKDLAYPNGAAIPCSQSLLETELFFDVFPLHVQVFFFSVISCFLVICANVCQIIILDYILLMPVRILITPPNSPGRNGSLCKKVRFV